jgi:hypothetical protein
MGFNIRYAAIRTLDRLLKASVDKGLHICVWKEEAERLSVEYGDDYEKLKRQREESKELLGGSSAQRGQEGPGKRRAVPPPKVLHCADFLKKRIGALFFLPLGSFSRQPPYSTGCRYSARMYPSSS